MKMRLRPRDKSYVCKARPMEVLTWKSNLPTDAIVKGTEVGHTKPIVCDPVSDRRRSAWILYLLDLHEL